MSAKARTGSIEVGKNADLVVLDHNLFAIPATEIDKPKVLLTLFGGASGQRRSGKALSAGAVAATKRVNFSRGISLRHLSGLAQDPDFAVPGSQECRF